MLTPSPRRPRFTVCRRLSILALLLGAAAPLHAQTIEDGIMMSSKSLCTGFMYGHDQLDRLLGRRAQARQPERRELTDAERRLDGQLRGHATAST